MWRRIEEPQPLGKGKGEGVFEYLFKDKENWYWLIAGRALLSLGVLMGVSDV